MITVILEYRLRLWLRLQVIFFLDYDYNHDYMISKKSITIMIMITM